MSLDVTPEKLASLELLPYVRYRTRSGFVLVNT